MSLVDECGLRWVYKNFFYASYKLLGYVAGIGPGAAKNLVEYRDTHGPFLSREAIKEIKGFGAKTFEQAAGFLRVPNSENPLDNSAVHPEQYQVVEKIASDLSISLKDMIGNEGSLKTVSFEKYVDETIGLPTLLDISAELAKPGRDPREEGSRMEYSGFVASIDDLKVGLKLKGTVTNVTKFGAFVDIGVHQDGLVHISELSDEFVKDPMEKVSVGEVLDIWVIGVDKVLNRISLSCKSQPNPADATTGSNPERSPNERSARSPRPSEQNARGGNGSSPRNGNGYGPRNGNGNGPRNGNNQNSGGRPRRHSPNNGDRRPHYSRQRPKQAEKSYSMDDLLSKFGRD